MLTTLLVISVVSVNSASCVSCQSSSSNSVSIGNRVRVTINARQQTKEELKLEFREKLQELKNERKRKVVEGFDEKISGMNVSWLDKWTRTLDRLSGILDKIESRAERAEVDIADEVVEARTVISRARGVVEAQGEKIYVIEFDDESDLGQGARATIAEVRADYNEVKESVSEAREAVYGALKSLANNLGRRGE
jgi:hypothetical protein